MLLSCRRLVVENSCQLSYTQWWGSVRVRLMMLVCAGRCRSGCRVLSLPVHPRVLSAIMTLCGATPDFVEVNWHSLITLRGDGVTFIRRLATWQPLISREVERTGLVPWSGGPTGASFGFYLRWAFQRPTQKRYYTTRVVELIRYKGTDEQKLRYLIYLIELKNRSCGGWLVSTLL